MPPEKYRPQCLRTLAIDIQKLGHEDSPLVFLPFGVVAELLVPSPLYSMVRVPLIVRADGTHLQRGNT